jgi:hypothetical protein
MGADPAPVPGVPGVPSPGPAGAERPAVAAAEPAGRLGWRRVAALFALAFAAYLASPVHQNGDSYLYFPTARSLLHDRTLDLDAYSSPAIERNYGLRRTPAGHDVGYFLVYAATPVVATLVAAWATRATMTAPEDRSVPAGSWSARSARRPVAGTAAVGVAFGWALAVHAHGAVVDVDCWNVAANPEMPHGRVWSWHDPQFLYREPAACCGGGRPPYGRRIVRNPRCDVDVSTAWGIRAAGR